MTVDRVARTSALVVFVIGVAYAGVLGVGIATAGATEPIRDPILAVMEVLTMLSALALVTLACAIHTGATHPAAPPLRRTLALLAVVFMGLMAGLTCAVHFVGLTAGRQLGSGTIEWPSVAYAAELLAWNVFLGLALFMAALVFDRAEQRAVQRALLLSAALCLVGTIGPAVGDMRLQRIGVVGYAIVLPVACLLLFRLPTDASER